MTVDIDALEAARDEYERQSGLRAMQTPGGPSPAYTAAESRFMHLYLKACPALLAAWREREELRDTLAHIVSEFDLVRTGAERRKDQMIKHVEGVARAALARTTGAHP